MTEVLTAVGGGGHAGRTRDRRTKRPGRWATASPRTVVTSRRVAPYTPPGQGERVWRAAIVGVLGAVRAWLRRSAVRRALDGVTGCALLSFSAILARDRP
ncbi:hypothetical protein [Actinomadura alba]|uniref:hypothetical protein n=1 Tax=Actinomadura alba TaxID=406431 RepID=UPI001C9C18E5|nr:hypothetical protein [Actinomadura alba]